MEKNEIDMKIRIIQKNNKFHCQKRIWGCWYTFDGDFSSSDGAERCIKEFIKEYKSSPEIIKNYSI